MRGWLVLLGRANLVFIGILGAHDKRSESVIYWNDPAHIALAMCGGLHPPLASAESSSSDPSPDTRTAMKQKAQWCFADSRTVVPAVRHSLLRTR